MTTSRRFRQKPLQQRLARREAQRVGVVGRRGEHRVPGQIGVQRRAGRYLRAFQQVYPAIDALQIQVDALARAARLDCFDQGTKVNA